MFRGWRSYKLVLGACLFAALAQAQEQQKFVELKYDVDPALQDCPSTAEFQAIVIQQLGYDPYTAGGALGVQVRVRATESGLEGTIDWSTDDTNKLGERRFTSRNEDCREMMKTVGFVVAVQIQLMATEKAKVAPGSEKEPGAGNQQAGNLPSNQLHWVTLSVRSFEVRPGPSDTSRWSIMAGLGPAIGFGLSPSPAAQGRLFLALKTGWFGLEAGAEATLPSTKREAYGGGFRQELFEGTLAACGWQGSIGVCGVGKLGQVRVHGTGVDRPASPSGLVAQLGPRLAYSLGLGNHFVLLGRIEGLYLLTPWTVDLNHLDVWTMPQFGALAGIDVAARLP